LSHNDDAEAGRREHHGIVVSVADGNHPLGSQGLHMGTLLLCFATWVDPLPIHAEIPGQLACCATRVCREQVDRDLGRKGAQALRHSWQKRPIGG